jgi:hypothetical protein
MNKRRRWKAKARRRETRAAFHEEHGIATGVVPMDYIGQHELDGTLADVYVYAGAMIWRPVFVPSTVH